MLSKQSASSRYLQSCAPSSFFSHGCCTISSSIYSGSWSQLKEIELFWPSIAQPFRGYTFTAGYSLPSDFTLTEKGAQLKISSSSSFLTNPSPKSKKSSMFSWWLEAAGSVSSLFFLCLALFLCFLGVFPFLSLGSRVLSSASLLFSECSWGLQLVCRMKMSLAGVLPYLSLSLPFSTSFMSSSMRTWLNSQFLTEMLSFLRFLISLLMSFFQSSHWSSPSFSSKGLQWQRLRIQSLLILGLDLALQVDHWASRIISCRFFSLSSSSTHSYFCASVELMLERVGSFLLTLLFSFSRSLSIRSASSRSNLSFSSHFLLTIWISASIFLRSLILFSYSYRFLLVCASGYCEYCCYLDGSAAFAFSLRFLSSSSGAGSLCLAGSMSAQFCERNWLMFLNSQLRLLLQAALTTRLLGRWASPTDYYAMDWMRPASLLSLNRSFCSLPSSWCLDCFSSRMSWLIFEKTAIFFALSQVEQNVSQLISVSFQKQARYSLRQRKQFSSLVFWRASSMLFSPFSAVNFRSTLAFMPSSLLRQASSHVQKADGAEGTLTGLLRASTA